LIRAELRRQLLRRRTWLGIGAMVVLPVLVAVILVFTGPPHRGTGTPMLVDLATGSGLNYALFAVSVISQLLLLIVVALFAGDPVASEASWGSLRYLLLRPVPRGQLLRVKLTVGLLLSGVAALALVLAAGLSGWLAFGGGGLTTPLGASLGTGESLRIFLLTSAYVTSQQLVVAALAFLLSTVTDAPLGAVGGAVLLMIVSSVLDAITSLGAFRYGLPNHYAFSWFGLLSSPQQTAQMVRGLVLQVPWTVVPLALAWRHFARKDILS